MTKTTIYTRVISGGDGSAWTKYFVSEDLRDYDAEQDDERFCDDTSTLEIEHEGELVIKELVTPVSYLFRYVQGASAEKVEAFAARFDVPIDELSLVPEEFANGYEYVDVVHQGHVLAKVGVYKDYWEKAGRDVRTYLST